MRDLGNNVRYRNHPSPRIDVPEADLDELLRFFQYTDCRISKAK